MVSSAATFASFALLDHPRVDKDEVVRIPLTDSVIALEKDCFWKWSSLVELRNREQLLEFSDKCIASLCLSPHIIHPSEGHYFL